MVRKKEEALKILISQGDKEKAMGGWRKRFLFVRTGFLTIVPVMTGKKKTGVESIEKIRKEDKAYGRVAE